LFSKVVKEEAMSEIWQLPALELSRRYANRDLSPVEALRASLQRIADVNPVLNAVVTVAEPSALVAAQDSEQRWKTGTARGPLDGVPVLVKDNILTRGLRTTWGSRLYEDFIPERDELPVARLRSAGAVIVGKTNVPEFTLQGYTDNPLFGVTRNPWNTALTPGGSSGGSVAAVAAGMTPLSLGTDGGGSIRRPVSHTGLVGLKPSRGRVARCNGFPEILLDFEVVGPIARSVDDLIATMKIIAQPDRRDASSLAFADRLFEPPEPLARKRILFVPRFGDSPVDPQIAASVAAAARNLQAIGHHVDVAEDFTLADALNNAWAAVSQVGLAWLLGRYEDWRPKVGAPIAAMADAGGRRLATSYFEALNVCSQLRYQLGLYFEQYDCLMTPAAAALPWAADETHPATIAGQEVGPRGHAVFTAFVNAAGCPAIAIPCDPAADGLPIGFQLLAPIGQDDMLCAIARQYERAHPWARWPQVPPAAPFPQSLVA
jgi:aspartyl-tRNA(Asn)/glutamyl-tRNA(Gln) amidotransferase subunit A